MNEKNLDNRHQSEEEFHDKKYEKEDSLPLHYSLNPTVKIYEDMKTLLGDLDGKRVLELGCGDGWITIDLASKTETLDTFDISLTAIEITQRKLQKRGLEGHCCVRKMSAEELEYPDSAFDIVFGFAILHHLDLEKAMTEIFRVMKPSGMAIFAEPLGTNPLLNLYRIMTPQYRTIDERPLNMTAFKKLVNYFRSISHTEYYFLSLFPLYISNIKGMSGIAKVVFRLFSKVDRRLFKILPWVRRYAWYSIIVLKK